MVVPNPVASGCHTVASSSGDCSSETPDTTGAQRLALQDTHTLARPISAYKVLHVASVTHQSLIALVGLFLFKGSWHCRCDHPHRCYPLHRHHHTVIVFIVPSVASSSSSYRLWHHCHHHTVIGIIVIITLVVIFVIIIIEAG